MPEVVIAKKATTCVQRLLDLKLQPWKDKSGHIGDLRGVDGFLSMNPVNQSAQQAGAQSFIIHNRGGNVECKHSGII
jgi:hypothetical protein